MTKFYKVQIQGLRSDKDDVKKHFANKRYYSPEKAFKEVETFLRTLDWDHIGNENNEEHLGMQEPEFKHDMCLEFETRDNESLHVYEYLTAYPKMVRVLQPYKVRFFPYTVEKSVKIIDGITYTGPLVRIKGDPGYWKQKYFAINIFLGVEDLELI